MKRKIVIIGGVAGGASAAARLRRLDESAEIIMFERGEDISYANCGLPYYIGGVIERRQALIVQSPVTMRRRFNIDVRIHSEVTAILRDSKQVKVRDLASGEEYLESYDYLVLSPGAAPVRPPIPGVDMDNVFTIRNIPDSDAVKRFIEENDIDSAVVVGGGFIGLEMAENLVHRGARVVLVEKANQILSPLDPEMAAIAERYLREQGVVLYLGQELDSIKGAQTAEEVVLKSGEIIPAGVVILGIGVRPEVKLAREAGLTIGETGGIEVNEYLQTSDPSIYAIGDAIQVRSYVGGHPTLIPLAGPANRQGRMAADNICGRRIKYPGTLGTAIAKVFDMTVASTGLNEKTLKRLNIKYQASYVHPAPHATYYPGGRFMSIKLLFDPDDGLLLGAQIVGFEGVDKRIDVLATCIHRRLTVFDLQALELAYAPPFSSARDPVNIAGYVAGNIVAGEIEVAHWHQVEDLRAEGVFFLDVRTPAEFNAGAISGAVNIPVDELRERLDEIPADRLIVVNCRSGQRSYIACRILKQHGFSQVRNLSGGWLTYDFSINR